MHECTTALLREKAADPEEFNGCICPVAFQDAFSRYNIIMPICVCKTKSRVKSAGKGRLPAVARMIKGWGRRGRLPPKKSQ